MIVVAFDDLDETIGSYSASCATEFLDAVEGVTPSIKINGKTLNQAFVDIKLDNLKEPFLFVAYCHGVEDALNAHKEPFVKVGLNHLKFSNAFVYTNACLSSLKLGPAMVVNGTGFFAGYNIEVPVFGDEGKNKILRKFDNYALILFVLRGDSINEAVKKAKKFIKGEIKRAYHMQMVAFAAELIEIRDSFQVLGNENLKFSHLVS